MKALLRVTTLLLALLALWLSGCGEGDEAPAPGDIEGTVTLMQSGDPVASTTVLLVQSSTLSAATEPALTDAAGHYAFTRIPPGRYFVLTFTTGGAAAQIGSYFVLSAGQRAVHDIVLRYGEHPLYRIQGTVRSATTGEPIAGAYVSPSLLEYIHLFGPELGTALPQSGLTDQQGRFSVSTTVVTGHADQPLGLTPINVTKSGYEPKSVVGRGNYSYLPMPAAGDTVLTIDVRLEPDGSNPTGSVRGRLMCQGSPVSYLGVALSVVTTADPDTFPLLGAKTLVPGKCATTGPGGEFLITDLHPGRYVLMPGYRPDDGYSGVIWDSRSPVVDWFDVAAGETTQLGDLSIMKGIATIAPVEDARFPAGSSVRFKWASVPGVQFYEVCWGYYGASGWQNGWARVSGTEYTVAGLPPGVFVEWSINAYGSQDTAVIATTEQPRWFHIQAGG